MDITLNKEIKPFCSNDLIYKITQVNQNIKFSYGDIISIKITNITEDNKVTSGEYLLLADETQDECPYPVVRLIARAIQCICTCYVESDVRFMYERNNSTNNQPKTQNNPNYHNKYSLIVEFISIVKYSEKYSETQAKLRQVEGNSLYGKGKFTEAIKFYRNAIFLQKNSKKYRKSKKKEIKIIKPRTTSSSSRNTSSCYSEISESDLKNNEEIKEEKDLTEFPNKCFSTNTCNSPESPMPSTTSSVSSTNPFFEHSPLNTDKNSVKFGFNTTPIPIGNLSSNTTKITDNITFKCLNNLAACYMQLEDFNNAIKVLKNVENRDPKNVKMLWRTGRANLKLKKYTEAEKYLKIARDLDPNSSVIKKDLKTVLKRISDEKMNEKKLYVKMLSREPTLTFEENNKKKEKLSPPSTLEEVTNRVSSEEFLEKLEILEQNEQTKELICEGAMYEGNEVENVDGNGIENVVENAIENEISSSNNESSSPVMVQSIHLSDMVVTDEESSLVLSSKNNINTEILETNIENCSEPNEITTEEISVLGDETKFNESIKETEILLKSEKIEQTQENSPKVQIADLEIEQKPENSIKCADLENLGSSFEESKVDLNEKTEQLEQKEQPVQPERLERLKQLEELDRPDLVEQPGQPEQLERLERLEQLDRPDLSAEQTSEKSENENSQEIMKETQNQEENIEEASLVTQPLLEALPGLDSNLEVQLEAHLEPHHEVEFAENITVEKNIEIEEIEEIQENEETEDTEVDESEKNEESEELAQTETSQNIRKLKSILKHKNDETSISENGLNYPEHHTDLTENISTNTEHETNSQTSSSPDEYDNLEKCINRKKDERKKKSVQFKNPPSEREKVHLEKKNKKISTYVLIVASSIIVMAAGMYYSKLNKDASGN